MVDSWVEPAISATENTIISMAGSAREAIIISRDEPMPPKLVPMSMPARARAKRALPSRAVMAIRSPDQLNIRLAAKVGIRAAATQVAAKTKYGADAEQPGGVVGDHGLLAQQAAEVAVRLDQGRAAAALQAGFDLADQPGQQRRQQQDHGHLDELRQQRLDHRHSVTAITSGPSAARPGRRRRSPDSA